MIGRVNTGGGSGCILTITAVASETVTISKNGKSKSKTTDSKGIAVFRGLDTGKWTIVIVRGGVPITRVVTVTADYHVAIPLFAATINITYPVGSTCTCSDGTTTLSAPDTSGTWVCTVPNAGKWTVTSTDGDKSKSADVVITTDGQTESVTLQYITYLFKDGETYDSLTGGWQGVVDAGKKAIRIDAPAEKTGFAYPKSKIDLTNYNTISAVVTENVSASSAFSLYITEAIGHSAVASVILGAAPATRVDLDVSSVTGSYYVMTSLYSEKGKSVYVTEVSMQWGV
jgi:hypothetical protein|nr:MAG TPA: hypothetical protein [Caudoviricetes sp.]